ncbi:hypothetical protein WBG78_16445 [Chryseolinea sp. T2]|uniref:hypothetical protein n=1 Tax=Chryseolinea sp. T2 TaxID=3129255 RepID=UPI003077DDB2
MSKQVPGDLFKGQFIGMYDVNGNALHEGDSVRLYYKGEFPICKIVYVPEWAMFCLQWPDGYQNKFPMNAERYERIKN